MISSSQRPLPDSIQHLQQKNIHAPVGFEPTISAGKRSQTYSLDHAATGTGVLNKYLVKMNRLMIQIFRSVARCRLVKNLEGSFVFFPESSIFSTARPGGRDVMTKQFLTMYFPSSKPFSVWVPILHVDLLQTVPTLNGDSYVFIILHYLRIRLSRYC